MRSVFSWSGKVTDWTDNDDEDQRSVLPDGQKAQARTAFFDALGSLGVIERIYESIVDTVSQTQMTRLKSAGSEERQAVGAINQYRGLWFEDLIVLDWFRTARALQARGLDALVALPMPKRTELRLEALWVQEIRNLVDGLEADLKAHGTVMRASNPDLILVRISTLARHCKGAWDRVLDASTEHQRILELGVLAKQLESRLEYQELVGVMSLKTSLRVDRKVQPLQEANRIKTLRKYIRTRIWQREDSPFGFFVVLMEAPKKRLHPGSPEVFYSNVLLYSIVSIDERPSAAVDSVLRITSTSGLRIAVDHVHAKLNS